MAFVRFVTAVHDPDAGVAAGPFEIAHELKEDERVQLAERLALVEILAWFDKNLKEPSRFDRSRSKGDNKSAGRGIAWFRDTSKECISRMHQLKGILGLHGHYLDMIRETRIGYIIYEDDLQVIAEPFSDTQTSPEG